MAHATLIQPPTVVYVHSLSFSHSIPPLGLAYISGAAKQAGHQVHVIDAPGEAIDEFHPIDGSSVEGLYIHGMTLDQIVRQVHPDSQVIGISHMFLHAWPVVRELVKQLKRAWPDKTIVLGGETPSAFWSHMAREAPGIDVCVLGEGEETFVGLLDALDAGTPVDEVPGLVCRDASGEMAHSGGVRKRITKIDELPEPDWGAFAIERYLAGHFASGVFRGRSLPMLATRGCPYRCTFCSSPGMWTTRYVMRDPEKVVDEIERYVRSYRIDNVDFLDLTAIINRRWILEFCQALTRRGLEITWQLPSGTRSEAIDREVAEALYGAGCRNISYSPESGSPRMLGIILKQIKLPSIIESMRAAVNAGMVTNANLILGLPGETWKDIALSYKLGMQLAFYGLHSLAVMMFAPYPGSALFDRLADEGQVRFDDDYYYSALLRSGKTTVSYNDFRPRTLVFLQLFFMVSFWGIQYLLRPGRLVRTIYRFKTGGRQESIMDYFLNTRRFYSRKRKQASTAIALTD